MQGANQYLKFVVSFQCKQEKTIFAAVSVLPSLYFSSMNNPSIVFGNTNDPKALTSWLSGERINKFLTVLAKFVYGKSYKNVEIVSCFYSYAIPRRILKENMLVKNRDPQLLLVPLIYDYRFNLAVFYLKDKKVEYYDSLKLIKCDAFFAAKSAVEKEFGIIFKEVPQDAVNATVNDNASYEFADFHICRIAEEICFHGKNQLLKPFEIEAEVGRIKSIVEMSVNSKWKGHWIPTIQFNLARVFRQLPSHATVKSFDVSLC